MLALDPRHPAFDGLCAVLRDLSGCSKAMATLPRTLPPAAVEPLYALGHQGQVAFRVVLQAVIADGVVDVETLRRRLPDVWPSSVTDNVELLVRDGILTRRRGGNVSLAPGLPSALPGFVLQIAAAFVGLEPRLAEQGPDRGSRPAAFVAAADGAARLFGTDVRLRNLMALAVHGPLLRRELRRITGTGHLHLEDRDEAPFGRGALVRVWETDLGPAVMLDRDHPLYLPLRRLLVALERVYPLPAFVPEYKAPKPPARRPWNGDRHALFGGIIPTTVVTSIGVHGWTFEALCCELATGHDRFNVKKAMRRLEDEGVLQGDRPRGPGFNVRVVTIADGFPAKRELEALLRAYAKAWPETATAVQRAFEKISRERPRGKAHLTKRGLWPY